MADVAVYPLVMVFTMRLFMTHLGEQQFGIWMWVNTIIASLSLVNIGFGDATVKYVAEYRSKGQMARAAGVINATLSVYIALAGGLALVCYAGAEVIGHFNLHRYFKIDEQNKALSLLAFQIGAITFCLRLVETIILSALRGLERYDASARLSILSKGLVLALNVWMVQHGYTLVQIFINSALVTLLGLCIQLYWVKRLVPQLSLVPSFSGTYLRGVKGYGFWSWVSSVLNVISAQMDKYIVSTLAGVSVFGYYSAASTMGERALGLVAAAAGFLFPIISARMANQAPMLKLYYKSQAVIVAGGMAAAALALWLQAPIFGFILKDKYEATAPFLRPFLIYLGTLCTTVVPFYFLMGAGLVRYGTIIRVCIICFQLVLVPGAYHYFGAAYMPLGLTFSHYLGSFIQATLMARHVYKTPALPFALSQGALPGLFFFAMAFNVPWVFLVAGPLVYKFIYFDKVSYVFKK